MKENKSSVIFEEANEGCSRRTSTCYDRARWRDFACSKCLRGGRLRLGVVVDEEEGGRIRGGGSWKENKINKGCVEGIRQPFKFANNLSVDQATKLCNQHRPLNE